MEMAGATNNSTLSFEHGMMAVNISTNPMTQLRSHGAMECGEAAVEDAEASIRYLDKAGVGPPYLLG